MGKLIGPLMLAILIGVAIFMLYVLQDPELAAQFRRPEGFYDNMFGKIGASLLFALAVMALVWLVRGRSK